MQHLTNEKQAVHLLQSFLKPLLKLELKMGLTLLRSEKEKEKRKMVFLKWLNQSSLKKNQEQTLLIGSSLQGLTVVKNK